MKRVFILMALFSVLVVGFSAPAAARGGGGGRGGGGHGGGGGGATTEDSLEAAVTHQVQLRIMRYFRPLDIEADIAGIITGDRCREVR